MQNPLSCSYVPAAAAATPSYYIEEKKVAEYSIAIDNEVEFFMKTAKVIADEITTVAFTLEPLSNSLDDLLSVNLKHVEDAKPRVIVGLNSHKRSAVDDSEIDEEDRPYLRKNAFGEIEFFIEKTLVAPWQVKLRKTREVKKKKEITTSQELLLKDVEELKTTLLEKLWTLKEKYKISHPLIVKSVEHALADFRNLQLKEASALGLKNPKPQHIYFKEGKPKFKTIHADEDFYKKFISNTGLVFTDCYIPNHLHSQQGKEAALFAQAEYRITVKKQKSAKARMSLEETWQDKKAFTSAMRGLWMNIGSKQKKKKDGGDKTDDKIISTFMLRRILSRNSNSCADWAPSNYKGVVHLLKRLPGFCADHEIIQVLDTSAGFGGRIIGAMATEEVGVYVGADPNTALIPGYRKILEHLGPLTSTQVKLLIKPSEELTAKDFLPVQKFKLMMTSPPYGHLEVYSEEDTQSSSRYIRKNGRIEPSANLDQWIQFYMCRTLFKVWKRLEDGGVIALNLADITVNNRPHSICSPILSFLNQLGMDYKGCIGLQFFNSFEPIWIFQKPFGNRNKYQVYDLTFKSAETRSLSSLTEQYHRYLALPKEERAWRIGFFYPKILNSLLKYRTHAIAAGNAPELVDTEMSESLGMDKTKLNSIFNSVFKTKSWQVIMGKGKDLVERTEPVPHVAVGSKRRANR